MAPATRQWCAGQCKENVTTIRGEKSAVRGRCRGHRVFTAVTKRAAMPFASPI